MGGPSDALVREQVGAALRAGDVLEAERLLRGRIAQVPNDVDAMAALGDILAQNGRMLFSGGPTWANDRTSYRFYAALGLNF